MRLFGPEKVYSTWGYVGLCSGRRVRVGVRLGLSPKPRPIKLLLLLLLALLTTDTTATSTTTTQPGHWGWFEMEYDGPTPPGGGWFEMYGNLMKNGFNPLEPPGAGPRKRG